MWRMTPFMFKLTEGALLPWKETDVSFSFLIVGFCLFISPAKQILDCHRFCWFQCLYIEAQLEISSTGSWITHRRRLRIDVFPETCGISDSLGVGTTAFLKNGILKNDWLDTICLSIVNQGKVLNAELVNMLNLMQKAFLAQVKNYFGGAFVCKLLLY